MISYSRCTKCKEILNIADLKKEYPSQVGFFCVDQDECNKNQKDFEIKGNRRRRM